MTYLKLALQGAAIAAVTGLIVSILCQITTGHAPSLLVLLLAAETASIGWGLVQAVRFRRRWQTVLAAYGRPALGEGIDTPHRPPVDEQ